MLKINSIYLGNNLDVLKSFPDNSIDSIVTDPPYGLGKEPNSLEVLQSWLTTGYHEVKGKGFMGKEWDAFVPQPNLWKECLRVLKPGGYLLSFSGTRTYDWIVMGLRIAGFEIRDMIAWVYGSGFPKSMDISKAIDKSMGAEREVIGKGKSGKTSHAFQIEETTTAGEYNLTEPSTDLAKQWQGWGTALKPALEPIVMARKPLEGTIANNVLKHGVGAINIDECRVGDELIIQEAGNAKSNGKYGDRVWKEKQSVGRFPANVIHDGSDEVEALFPQTQSGLMTPNHTRTTDGSPNGIYGKFDVNYPLGETYGDSGSASRFFYTAKASQKERNWGLNTFEVKRHSDRLKADGVGGDNPRNRTNKYRKNIHPTVKPIDLMRYLVRLVTPKNGICLDPYVGSGTTAVACKAEKFNYIGIDLEADYVEIAKARLKAENVIYDIFDFMEG